MLMREGDKCPLLPCQPGHSAINYFTSIPHLKQHGNWFRKIAFAWCSFRAIAGLNVYRIMPGSLCCSSARCVIMPTGFAVKGFKWIIDKPKRSYQV